MFRRIRETEKVLNEGGAFPESPRVVGVAARDRYVKTLCGQEWWKRRSIRRGVPGQLAPTIVLDSYRCHQVGSNTIKVWAPHTPVNSVLPTLHGLAHAIVGWDGPHPHGPEFAKMYLELVAHYDKALGARLKEEFKNRKIKTRTWSPEAKEAAQRRAASKQLIEMLVQMRDETGSN